MGSPQFRRKPGARDPVSREEMQRKCAAWGILVSNIDDCAIAKNEKGVQRNLNRLYESVKAIRFRHSLGQ